MNPPEITPAERALIRDRLDEIHVLRERDMPRRAAKAEARAMELLARHYPGCTFDYIGEAWHVESHFAGPILRRDALIRLD